MDAVVRFSHVKWAVRHVATFAAILGFLHPAAKALAQQESVGAESPMVAERLKSSVELQKCRLSMTKGGKVECGVFSLNDRVSLVVENELKADFDREVWVTARDANDTSGASRTKRWLLPAGDSLSVASGACDAEYVVLVFWSFEDDFYLATVVVLTHGFNVALEQPIEHERPYVSIGDLTFDIKPDALTCSSASNKGKS